MMIKPRNRSPVSSAGDVFAQRFQIGDEVYFPVSQLQFFANELPLGRDGFRGGVQTGGDFLRQESVFYHVADFYLPLTETREGIAKRPDKGGLD